ncbi:MAG: hypothetical protein U1F77_12565 [Kiritimatiellia bacterium]
MLAPVAEEAEALIALGRDVEAFESAAARPGVRGADAAAAVDQPGDELEHWATPGGA